VRLAPTQTATSVRTRGNEQLVTDGPYAETKETLVGFYLVDCENLDQAIAYARRIPVAPQGDHRDPARFLAGAGDETGRLA